MWIEGDEEIGGAVAAILVVVALALSRLGRDRLAHLADQLLIDLALLLRPVSLGRIRHHASPFGLRVAQPRKSPKGEARFATGTAAGA